MHKVFVVFKRIILNSFLGDLDSETKFLDKLGGQFRRPFELKILN